MTADFTDERIEEAYKLLSTISNPHRLKVLCCLSEGEMNVAEIHAKIDISQSSLSQHLSKLRNHGIVSTRRDGIQIHYRLADGKAKQLLKTLHELFCAK